MTVFRTQQRDAEISSALRQADLLFNGKKIRFLRVTFLLKFLLFNKIFFAEPFDFFITFSDGVGKRF